MSELTYTLKNIFALDLPLLEKILRPILVYFFLVVALRLAGKREIAQLNPFDLVVLLTLSNTVQNAIIGNDNSLTGGIIGASTLLIMNYAVVRFLYSSPKVDRWIEGKAVTLMTNGKVNKAGLKKELITLAELESAAHKQGFSSLGEVDRAILEPEGAISFFAQKPLPEETRHQELLKRMNELSKELGEIRSKLGESGKT
jgi:uncharacterized membrane protein YcaP (DUF421 family)